MKQQYRLFRRGKTYYSEDSTTGKQQSLGTKDKTTAVRLLNAKNEASRQTSINLQIARVYLSAGDPLAAKRTWQNVMDEMATTKRGNTKARWERAVREEPFNLIRDVTLFETRAEQFLKVLSTGTISTNIFLRRLHNFSLDMNWLPTPIIPRRQWPRIEFKEKRGVTAEEHQKILQGERNPEWVAYYNMLWHIGGSQSDVANLCAEDVDWEHKVIGFNRMKTGSVVQIHFGNEVENLLKDLPGEGPLFRRIARMKESDRGSLFRRRCRLVGVSGVSLHSYRYSWAERARAAGYPERFAQEALGHASKAVHRAYAKRAQVKIPSLEDYEKASTQKALISP
jgi:integrase